MQVQRRNWDPYQGGSIIEYAMPTLASGSIVMTMSTGTRIAQLMKRFRRNVETRVSRSADTAARGLK